MTDNVLISRHDRVALLTLNRAARRNALDLTLRAAIAEAVRKLDADDSVGALVIYGGEDIFAAGADLNLLVDKGAREVEDLDLGQYWAPLLACRKPLFAAVNGFALGAGCELAMMCDVVIADNRARFGQPELRVGIMPGAGGTQRLVRHIGRPAAALMLLCGEMIDGERAAALGLVSALVPEGEVLARALALAAKAAAMPPRAVRAVKRVLAQGADLPLPAALALEHREFLLLFDTQDKTEGMRAFLEKRTAQFSGQ